MGNSRKMTYESITSTLVKLCQQNNIVLVLNDPNIDKDNGCCFGDDEIHLGKKYSSNLIMLAIVFHEYGHIMITRRNSKKYRSLSIFEEESLAWILAMEYQKKIFKKSFTKSQGNFMLKCLGTYSKQHYHFSKGYNVESTRDDD